MKMRRKKIKQLRKFLKEFKKLLVAAYALAGAIAALIHLLA